MKRTFLAVVLISAPAFASAQYYQQPKQPQYGNNYRSNPTPNYGYTNPNSVYVAPSINRNGGFTDGHYRTAPNRTTTDNYGTYGNVNPYTGRTGTRRPKSLWD